MRTFKLLGRIGIITLAILSASVIEAQAQDSSSSPSKLAEIQHKIDAGDFKAASNLSSTYLKSNQTEAKAHYLLGQSLFKLGKFAQSKVELKEATKMASAQHMNDVAVAANDLLIKLPKDLAAPHQKYSVAKIKGRRVAAAGFAHPRLLSFYAAWAEPCKQLSVDLDKVHTEYGEQLEILKVDVDDPANQKIMEQYDISPVPTVVFLDTEGKVTNYFVGYDSATELNSSVKKALNKN
jgi:thioredoxin-like negative regulator of GroEL